MSLFSPLLPISGFQNWKESILQSYEVKPIACLSEVNFRKRLGSRNEKYTRRNVSSVDDGKLDMADCCAKRNLAKSNYFEDEQVRLNGSIFQHRYDLSSLKAALPWDRQNSYNIKMEDDCPQGGDDTRLAVLRALGTYNYRTVPCVLCQTNLIVYDRYPLIDGTFFLSPIAHRKMALNMKYESKNVYLHALCVHCMHSNWSCMRCSNSTLHLGPWLVVGALYAFDILSVSKCCQPFCGCCLRSMVEDEIQNNIYVKGNYNLLSTQIHCPSCGGHDYHYIRRVNHFRKTALDSE